MTAKDSLAFSIFFTPIDLRQILTAKGLCKISNLSPSIQNN